MFKQSERNKIPLDRIGGTVKSPAEKMNKFDPMVGVANMDSMIIIHLIAF